MAVNLFAVAANAESAELRSMVVGDDEILIEKSVSKSGCLLRVASMLGSHWINDKVELQRISSIKREGASPRYASSFHGGLANAKYGLDLAADELSISMNMKF